MKLDNRIIDLSRADIPLLAIIAEIDDDLASPESFRLLMIMYQVTIRKVRFNVGHVGLCISIKVHKTLWPEISE